MFVALSVKSLPLYEIHPLEIMETSKSLIKTYLQLHEISRVAVHNFFIWNTLLF